MSRRLYQSKLVLPPKIMEREVLELSEGKWAFTSNKQMGRNGGTSVKKFHELL